MAFNIIFILIGFVFLIVGADVLVKGASNIAKRFGIPEVIIGLTIVCIGTSMPELFITITSATKGYTDLIVGNAVGSNLCNLLLILGLVSMIRPVKLEKEIRDIHLPIAIFATLLVLFIGNTVIFSDKFAISQIEGIILLILFILYFSYPIIIAIRDIIKTEEKEKITHHKKHISIFTSMIYIILGVILLKYGGDFVVDNSETIATYFGISEHIIGLTIVAIGTALPELVTSIIAVIKKDSGLAVGNLIGSSMLNLWLILGIGSVITPLVYTPDLNITLIILAIATFLVWIFGYIGKKYTITRPKATILLSLFLFYIIRIFLV